MTLRNRFGARLATIAGLVAVLLVTCGATLMPAAAQAAGNVVISQVYGGGGNVGSTWKNDFIELHNRSNVAVSLAGWSVQYASSAGSSWAKTDLSGTIQPGAYYLVQEAAQGGGTISLPTPDATGTILMSATAGKVALVSSTTLLTGTCPTGGSLVDFLGFGGVGTNCSETSPLVALTNTTAALRGNAGCLDADNNSTDFATGAPIPRNSTYALYNCTTYTLTYTAGAGGSIVGTSPQTVNHGANGTLVTATPSLGYHFVSWSDAYPTAARTDLNVTANVNATANFAIDTFTLTYTAGAGGSIVGASPQTVNYNTNGTLVTATPSLNYHFVSWSDA